MVERMVQSGPGGSGVLEVKADKLAGSKTENTFENEVRDAARNFTLAQLDDPRRPRAIPDLLGSVWGLAEGVIAASEMVLPYQQPLACRNGCSYCCYMQATASGPEILAIAEYIEANMSDGELDALRARVAETDGVTGELDSFGRLFANVPCPLLRDGGCSVYEVRPLVCRGYNSLHWVACAHDGRRPSYWKSVPHDAVRRGAYSAALDGICEGLNKLGLSGEPLELISALNIVLNDPSAFERWLNCEDVFAEASENRKKGRKVRECIDGTIYDTDNATLIAAFEYGKPGEADYRKETLYRSGDGRYLLAGIGGLDSYYSQLFEGDYIAGKDLLPIRADEARRWLEDQRFTDILEQRFPDVSSTPPDLTVIGVRLSGEKRQRAERAAARAGTSVEIWIEQLVACELSETGR